MLKIHKGLAMNRAILMFDDLLETKGFIDLARGGARKKPSDDPTMCMKTKGKYSDKRDDPTMSLKTHQLQITIPRC